MKARELVEPVCAVIHLAHQHPAVLHMVVLDPGKIKNGSLIRLGDFPGDEAVGWQYLESIEVLQVLGRATYDAEKRQVTVAPINA